MRVNLKLPYTPLMVVNCKVPYTPVMRVSCKVVIPSIVDMLKSPKHLAEI